MLLCTPLSALACIDGIAVFGKDDVQYGCAVEAPRPAIGGPYYENTEIVKAERTFFPLGALCILDSPDDTVGPQTVRLQSWPATAGWLGAAGGALGGAGLIVSALLPRTRSPRRM